ncbi:LPXTG cell wall anchor domain-containing protein [Arthrobacter sp. OY3WO11]|uniref:LPXTG cell wall anchor domain-containing protein n=1 Tax=Arthrobacter sp. OY3WO11 TaxID=1835723 RepID=UPI0007CF481B|nr:LPXTG cell wall anchor domain-containing protein [Arthrobacter sp. OY3WO11]OAE01139.1 hypothetical protein A6A22_06625 [Arthrobacter sp. OY3WO11]
MTGGVSTAPAAGSTAVGGAIVMDTRASSGTRNAPAQGATALANTGVDASLAPLALLLLAAGLLMLRKRKMS